MSHPLRYGLRALGLCAAICACAPAVRPGSADARSRYCPGAETRPSAAGQDEYAESLLCLINNERRKRHMRPLHRNRRLDRASTGHSASMRSGSYFSHVEPDGTTFEKRIAASRYLKRARKWLIGENIGWGSSSLGTPVAIVDAWMHSPPHRENILTRRFRNIGLGLASGTPSSASQRDGIIITTDFGFVRRRGRR